MLSYQSVVEAIEAETDRLETLIADLALAYDADAEAEIAFKSRRAAVRIQERAIATERLPADHFEDLALAKTEQEYATHLRARAHLQTLREARGISESRLDGLRTLSAGFRSAGG